MKNERKGRVEMHNDGHKMEHHHDNDMHRGFHEEAYGHMKKGYSEMSEGKEHIRPQYEGYEGEGMKGRGGREIARDIKMEGGGRQAKQHKQRMETGFRDDTVYGKMPPRPGKIDS